MSDPYNKTTAVERLRKALDAPVSLVGGVTTILNIADVLAVLDEIERLRARITILENDVGWWRNGFAKDQPHA